MKKYVLIALIAGILTAGQGFSQSQKAPPAPPKSESMSNKGPFKTEMERVSYCIGLNIGDSMKRDSLDINLDMLMKGLKDKLGNKKPLLTDDEIRMTMSTFQQKMMQKQREEFYKSLEKNTNESKKFFSDNRKKKGVVSTPSGLQYKILKSGTGRSPKPDEMIEVNYEGKLLDGKVFDSSYERGQPALFMASRLIPGWREALTLMNSGSQWEVYIPGSLGYGDRGMPQAGIGPEAALIFKVELISIKSNMPPPPSMQQQQQRPQGQ